MKKIFVIWLGIFFACKDREEKNKELWEKTKSPDIGRIISATEEIRKAGDTSMVGALFYHADDPRMSTALSYKGKTIYQLKMEALKRITGTLHPSEITYKVDTSIIQFYLKMFPQHSFVSYKLK